ncbi:hypothetical protein [Zhongshania marina]|uniref:hypothetical protein n=1 Tax=Zhongshania marina TaxID=2304603 RepID=UPI000CDAB6E6|nr:hypothetical protein [Marortus luteolus]
MARSGGRYVLEKDGKRRLVSRTNPQPRKGAAKAGNAVDSKTAPKAQSKSASVVTEKEAK